MAILLQNLRKHYAGPDGSIVPVIDIPSFLLGDAEQVALVGSSGSGKTTLLHLIAGILSPDGGRILFGPGPILQAQANRPASSAAVPDSVDMAQLSEAQCDIFRGQHIGYIFQTHHLLAGFTAMENVLLGMTFTGRSHDRAWAMRLLEEVGLADRLNYKPQKLSVGQQQRVAVARALANRPSVVLADEPTGALDAKNAQQALELIRKLCAEAGASLLLVSHDMQIAGQLQRMVSLTELNRAAV
jgi:putative ABC transport system ATP-binding protein